MTGRDEALRAMRVFCAFVAACTAAYVLQQLLPGHGHWFYRCLGFSLGAMIMLTVLTKEGK